MVFLSKGPFAFSLWGREGWGETKGRTTWLFFIFLATAAAAARPIMASKITSLIYLPINFFFFLLLLLLSRPLSPSLHLVTKERRRKREREIYVVSPKAQNFSLFPFLCYCETHVCARRKNGFFSFGGLTSRDSRAPTQFDPCTREKE